MNPRVLLNKAMALTQQGKPGPARAICKTLLQQQPDHFDALHLHAILDLRDGRYGKAQTLLHRALSCPAPSKQRAQAQSNLALALLYQGKADAALQAINRALRSLPRQAEFLANRANIHETLSDWPAMAADLEQVLEQHPGDPDLTLSLAIAYRQQGRFTQALERLDPLLQRNVLNTDQTLLKDLAKESLLLHGLASGIDGALHRAAQWAPRLGEALYAALGDYCCDNGHNTLALHFYRQAQRVLPNDSALQHCIDALEGSQTERAPESYIEQLYDQHAAGFEQRLLGRLGYRAPLQLPPLLKKQGYRSFKRVLDLGCGTGLCGQHLSDQLPIETLTGVDLSQGMLALAADKGCYHRLHHQNIDDFLTQSETRYQLITALDVLIYSGDLTALIHRAADRLTPGGIFAFTVERGTNAEYHLQGNGRYRHSESYLRRLSQEAGLSVVLCKPLTLRTEHDRSIDGLLLLLKR